MTIDKKLEQAYAAVVELTANFCDKYLNEDYKELCEEMAVELVEVGVPINKGRPASWASGIVHALGWVNFLQDPAQSPHMSSTQVAEGFGVSPQTMLSKSRIIRDELELLPMDPDWCIPAMLADNPLVWMIDVGGFLIDARYVPREIQVKAYRLGLIPFIPADRQEPQLESDTGPKVIRFPSGRNETSKAKSPHKPKGDGPGQFEGLEE